MNNYGYVVRNGNRSFIVPFILGGLVGNMVSNNNGNNHYCCYYPYPVSYPYPVNNTFPTYQYNYNGYYFQKK